MEFVNLHAHTNIGSMLDALNYVDDLFDAVKSVDQKALAVTDHGTLAAHFDAFKAYKRTGVKFIPGCEMYYVNSYDLIEGDKGKPKKEPRKHIVLLAQNEQGYKNLLKLNFIGFQNQDVVMGRVFSKIDWENLKRYSDGLVVTSACGSGPISKLVMAGKYDEGKRVAEKFAEVFDGRFFLEIHPHNLFVDEVTLPSGKVKPKFDQNFVNQELIKISKETGIPLVTAADTHYLTRDMEKYHDILLAINSKKSVNDPERFRYGIDEFYVKTGAEIFEFLSSNYGEAVATEAIENTVRISDMCEAPDYMNMSGNHLPNFPVQDEPDYQEFLNWREEKGYHKLQEDTAYMRYKVMESFNEKFSHMSKEDKKERWARVKHELKVLEGNDFSSYMLVVADFIRWAKSNNILVGPGRGCLSGDALVLTSRGFKELKEIKMGELVFTHTGQLKRVLNTFQYDVEEDLLKIKTDFSFGDIKLTRDHKLWAVKAKKTRRYEMSISNNWAQPFKGKKYILENNPTWIEAQNLEKDDYIFMPFPKTRRNVVVDKLNLAPFIGPYDSVVGDDIISKIPLINQFAIRHITKETGFDRGTIQRAKRGDRILKSTRKEISSFLDQYNVSFDEWQNEPNIDERVVKKYINVDEEFCYVLGRWIGDGWIIDKNQSYGIGIAFNRSDLEGKRRISSYFRKLGFYVGILQHKTKELDQLIVYSYSLARMFRELFPDYKDKSNTKYMGNWKYLPNNKLKSLLDGIIDSDGCRKDKTRDCIDTTSERLVKDIKEVLMYLGAMSSVSVRDEYQHGDYLCNKSYKIRFYLDKTSRVIEDRLFDNGYYVQIKDLSEEKINKVYDIQVSDDHSYLSQNYAVHNSVGGCMVAHLLGIHSVDPLEYGLLFERFQNAGKKDLPDIDIDFTSAGRDLVQEYVRQKYGADHCAQVSNINTYTPKNVIPDLVKSMRDVLPNLVGEEGDYFAVSNAIKKAIPDDAKTLDDVLNGNLDKSKDGDALKKAKKLQAFAAKAPELMDAARVIIGMPKEYSTHAAAMVISDIPILDFAPLRVDKNGAVAVQYEKSRSEALGLIKMDFLAISTLDVIDETFKNINRLGVVGAPKNMDDIPMGDEATYEMIKKGQTRCVFQLGKSGTMAGLCKQVKPQNILDIAAINALGRPSCGPINQPDGSVYNERKEYIMRRDGLRSVSFLHSSLEISLKETFGLCIMEEQLMGVARDVAGWDLNKADGLRKLTKLKGKNPQLAQQLEKDFINDSMEKHGMSLELATEIWEKVVEKFSGYGFNRSHAVFYSIIGYYTAYLKRHYPAAFLAAYLKIKTERGGITKDAEISMAKMECKRMQLKILPPDINNSGLGYDVLDNDTIVMGFAAIKGLGEKAVREIVNNQSYDSFIDFIYKTDGRVINKSILGALAKAGCFDSLSTPRKAIHDEGKSVRDKLNAFMRKKLKDGYHAENAIGDFTFSFKDDSEWPKDQQLRYEQEVLGELVSGTINDLFPGFFLGYGVTPLARLRRLSSRADLVVEVIIRNLSREFRIKKDGRLKGKIMAKYQVEDVYGHQAEMSVWPDLYLEVKKNIKEGEPLRARCRVSEFEGSKSLMLMEIQKCLRRG